MAPSKLTFMLKLLFVQKKEKIKNLETVFTKKLTQINQKELNLIHIEMYKKTHSNYIPGFSKRLTNMSSSGYKF